MSFPQITVTHAQMCEATKDGPITIKLVGEVLLPKYAKHDGIQNFQLASKSFQYQIPNKEVAIELARHTGELVTIQATGMKAAAYVDVTTVAAPAAKLPRASVVEEEPPTAEVPPPVEQNSQKALVHGVKLRSISYGRTVNLGNYENFRLEMTVDINDCDNSNEAMAMLQKTVDAKCASITKQHSHAPL